MAKKYYCYCDSNCKYETLTKEQILAAITQAVNEGTVGNVDTGFVTTIKTITGQPLKFFVGTQNEYENLTTAQKEGLFSIITNDTSKEGILASIESLRYDFDDWVASLRSGQFKIASAANAETADKAMNDGEGNNIVTTYAKNFTGYMNLMNNSTPLPKGTLLVYGESPSNTAKCVGDVIASGKIELGSVGTADYAKPYPTNNGAIKITNSAIVLGQIYSDTYVRKYLIQIM